MDAADESKSLAIWMEKNPGWNRRKANQRRHLFLRELGTCLIVPLVELRSQHMNGVYSRTQCAVQAVLNRSVAVAQPQPVPSNKPAKCTVCINSLYGPVFRHKRDSANKVKQLCDSCGKLACKKHSQRSTMLTCDNCRTSLTDKMTTVFCCTLKMH